MDIAVLPWLAPLTRFLLGGSPLEAGITGACVGWLVCPIYMYVLALVSERRWPKYDDQFKAFMPGNLFLGTAFGAATYLAARALRDGSGFFSHFPSTLTWMMIPVMLSVLAVLVLSAQDIVGAIRHKPGDTHTFHWRQLLGWTKIYHNTVVYGLYTWLLVALGVPGLLLAPADVGGVLGRVVLVIFVGLWVRMLIVDGKSPKHRTGHIALHGAAGVLMWVNGLLVNILACVLISIIL
jgi:hypothetical protein